MHHRFSAECIVSLIKGLCITPGPAGDRGDAAGAQVQPIYPGQRRVYPNVPHAEDVRPARPRPEHCTQYLLISILVILSFLVFLTLYEYPSSDVSFVGGEILTL